MVCAGSEESIFQDRLTFRWFNDKCVSEPFVEEQEFLNLVEIRAELLKRK